MLAGDLKLTSLHTRSSIQQILPIGGSFPHEMLSLMDMLHSWLAFDGDGQYMYCTLCTNGKKVNGMMKGAKCTNFQKTTLDRHVSLYDHQMLLQAPELRQDLDTVKQECIEAGCCYESSFFKTVHFLTVEDIPLAKFQALVNFLYDLGHEELDILKLSDIGYKSSYTATEL